MKLLDSLSKTFGDQIAYVISKIDAGHDDIRKEGAFLMLYQLPN